MTGVALTAQIHATNAAGKAALGLYLVPGFPDWETSIAGVKTAVRMGVDFIEFPLLAGQGWSKRTGSMIAQVLSQVGTSISGWSEPLAEWLSHARLPVAIAYESAWPKPHQWLAAQQPREASAAILLEGVVTDEEWYATQASAWGTCLIPVVSGCATPLDQPARDRLSRGGGFVYVRMGSKTGELSADMVTVRAVVDSVRQRRPDLPILCAFGLRAPADIYTTLTGSKCDGVIIGTGALEILQNGVQSFTRWLTGIMQATASATGAGI